MCNVFFQLEDVKNHIEKYFERFRNLLGPGNRRYIQTLMVFCRAFLQALCTEKDVNCTDPFQEPAKTSGASFVSNSTMAINDFLFSLNIDNINLIKLLQYIKESNIMHKVKYSCSPAPSNFCYLFYSSFFILGCHELFVFPG